MWTKGKEGAATSRLPNLVGRGHLCEHREITRTGSTSFHIKTTQLHMYIKWARSMKVAGNYLEL